MRILLFAALCATGYADLASAGKCDDAAGDGGTDLWACPLGFHFKDGASHTSISDASGADDTAKRNTACCAACVANFGGQAGITGCTHAADKIAQGASTKCNIGKGLTSGACAACNGTDKYSAIDDELACQGATVCGKGVVQTTALDASTNRVCSGSAVCFAGTYACSGTTQADATKCNAGYKYVSAGTKCVACGATDFIEGDDHATAACVTRTIRACSGAFAAGPPATGGYAKAGSTSVDNKCTACTGDATECSDASTAVKCAAGFGFAGGNCTTCDAAKFALANGTVACAARKLCTGAGFEGKFLATNGLKVAENTCGDCAANTVTCTDATHALTCAVGWFKNSDVCTKCTVTGSGNTVKTGKEVPTNATGTAGKWMCTEAGKSYFDTWACDATFEKDTAGTACVAKSSSPAGTPATVNLLGTCKDKAGKEVTAQKDKGKAACVAVDATHVWTETKVSLKGTCKDKAGKEVTAQKDKGKAACIAVDATHVWTAAKKDDDESPAFIAGAAIGLIALLL